MSNYRPIALQQTIFKIMENYIPDKMDNFFFRTIRLFVINNMDIKKKEVRVICWNTFQI